MHRFRPQCASQNLSKHSQIGKIVGLVQTSVENLPRLSDLCKLPSKKCVKSVEKGRKVRPTKARSFAKIDGSVLLDVSYANMRRKKA